MLIEDIDAFEFEGTRVFAAPDFGYWSTADRLQLVDWKTGGNGGTPRCSSGAMRSTRSRCWAWTPRAWISSR